MSKEAESSNNPDLMQNLKSGVSAEVIVREGDRLEITGDHRIKLL